MHITSRRTSARFAMLAFAALCLHPASVAAAPESSPQKLWGTYWTVESGFTSTLEMKNNRVRDTLTARVSLYFANGQEYYLPAVTMAPRQAVVISINDAMEALPATMAARAGKEGTVAVEFDGPNSSAIMGSVTVTNPREKLAWNFFLYPERPGLEAAPLQGVFWFADKHTDGFVAVQNITETVLTLTPSFEIASAKYAATPVALGPGQLHKLELRKELRKLGLRDATSGGIELTYQGDPDGIRAHGVLFDGKGFSAEIDFLRRDAFEAPETFYFRTPRFAIGAADPVLGLPARTRFQPYVILHNFAHYAMNLTLLVGYKAESATNTKEIEVPVAVPAGTTRTVSLESYLAEMPPGTHWANLELSYSGTHNNLATSMVSVSEDGKYSIRSVLNWVEGSNREGWHWSVDKGRNTVVSIQNSDSQEAQVAFSLDYQEGGVARSYDFSTVVIPARGTHHVNIGEVIAAGAPDADGDVIRPSVSFGGYRARKLGAGHDQNITTEALLIDRTQSNFLSVYNTGCCDEPIIILPTSINWFAGTSLQLRVVADSCTGEEIDYTDRAFKKSSNTSIVTVDSSGLASLVGAGTAKITATLSHLLQNPLGGCARRSETRECSVTSKPRLDLITPARGPIGASTMVTIRGSGFKDPATISAGTGITVTANSVNETQIVATFDVSTTAPAGNHAVTVTVNNMVSSSVNFFVQVPTSLSGPAMGGKVTYNGTELRDCFSQPVTPVFFGYSRCADYVVFDQANTRINAELEIREDVTVQATNVGLTSHTGEGATDSTGLFKDFLAFGNSTTGPPAGAFAIQRQILRALSGSQTFTLRVNCVHFQDTDVSVTDRTAHGVNVNCTQ